jgi:hypothetical protein
MTHEYSTLSDIVEHIQIGSDFCIYHASGQQFGMSSELALQLHQFPQSVQDQYLRLQLQSFLLNRYFKGRDRGAQEPSSDVDQGEQSVDQNDDVQGPNQKFFNQLHERNQGTGYFEPGWQILRNEPDGKWVVTKDQFTLHIERHWHLDALNQSAKIGDSVAIRMPKNRVDTGLYVAVGNGGLPLHDPAQVGVDIYFHFSPDAALEIMQHLTQPLNSLQVPFTFQVPYYFDAYQHWDAGVLTVNRTDYSRIQPILSAIYRDQRSQFQAATPYSTKPIAPGLGLAEVSASIHAQSGFGRDRCQLVANGLFAAWRETDESPTNRLQQIQAQFIQCGLSWERPFLNGDQEDAYDSLVSDDG